MAPLTAQETAPFLRAEAQAWWQETPESPIEHIHMKIDAPYYRIVSGVVPFRTTLLAHFLNGTLNLCEGNGLQDRPLFVGEPASMALTMTRDYGYDTTLIASDGWSDVRLQCRVVDSQGRRRHVRLRGSWQLSNGKPVNTSKPDELRAESWAASGPEDAVPRGYTSVHLRPATVDLLSRPLPRAKVTVPVLCKSSNDSARNFTVAIDPNFHADDLGIIQLALKGAPRTYVSAVLDFSQLPAGDHKISFKCDDEGVFPGKPMMAQNLMITVTVQ